MSTTEPKHPLAPSEAVEPSLAAEVERGDGAPADERGASPWRRFARRFRGERAAVAALAFLVLVVAVAVLAPVLAPADPNAQVLLDRLAGPSAEHWLGTDDLGRDVLSRLLYAARVSLVAALQATGVAVVLGVPLGLVAGYLGGPVDLVVSRLADAAMSIPAILLALAIIGVLEPNLTNAMIAIGLVYAPRFYRVVRAATLSVSEETFVEAARASGSGVPSILVGHILPNILSPLVVQISISMGFAMLAEAGISFLGLGVQPPDASWGTMLGRSTRFMEEAPHLVLAPGVLIFLTVLSLNVLGDGIRDSLGRELRRVS